MPEARLVVSDTSVISNLAMIGRLEILRNQHSIVVIPGEVNDELVQAKSPGVREAVQAACAAGWMACELLNRDEALFAVKLQLDPGEAAAISLCVHRKASLLCIDERKGRDIARSLKVPTVGLLGLLLREKAAGRITAVRDCIRELRLRANFFMSDALIEEVLISAGE